MRSAARSFLKQNGWADALVTPIAGDLSARRYFRLSQNCETVILMDDEAGLNTSLPAFVAMTHWLRDLGLSAPAILADGREIGFLLLEDLGREPVSHFPSASENRQLTMDTCIKLLLKIREAPPPVLARPTAEELCGWTCLADEYYPGADSSLLARFRAVLEPVLTHLCQAPATVSLRDFHADNLMWLPNRTGVASLGLLDYQDAMLTHPVYDLVSLLTDARSEIPQVVRKHYIELYSQASGDDHASMSEAFAAFSLQRNLRILGIFHRAARLYGKSHHLPKIPRVYGYVKEALGHESFSGLLPLLSRALPPTEQFP